MKHYRSLSCTKHLQNLRSIEVRPGLNVTLVALFISNIGSHFDALISSSSASRKDTSREWDCVECRFLFDPPQNLC